MNQRLFWKILATASITVAQGLVACAHSNSNSNSETAMSREPASADLVAIHYLSPESGGTVDDVVTPERWKGSNHGFSAGGRADYLVKFWSAANRNFSNQGKRHAVCFTGAASEIGKKFFDPADTSNFYRGAVGSKVPKTRASEDEQQINVLFKVKLAGARIARSYYFRMNSCSAGKMPLIDVSAMSNSRHPSGQAAPAAAADPADPKLPAKTVASVTTATEDGFAILDVLNPADAKSTKVKTLPRFKLRADYSKVSRTNIDRPWSGLDVTTEKGAAELAAMLQLYFYEGMATQDTVNVDNNFVAEKNTTRAWCHMPWLNVGDSGREVIHGLTKERNLFPSPMEGFTSVQSGTDWGVGYYNGPGCKTIGDIFGDASQPKSNAVVPSGVNFPEGTISAKILFTTSPTFASTNAYTWMANVSGVNSNERSVQPVKHIQMDISIRDGSIKGARAANHNWIMLTYYFDAAFDYNRDLVQKYGLTGRPWLAGLSNLPDSLKHMRPMGVQPGFGPPGPSGDSIILSGAKTNGVGGRLNGPADNPKSSCIACHGTAGTTTAMSPGFMADSDFATKGVGNIDFSQQLALAKRNMHPPGQP